MPTLQRGGRPPSGGAFYRHVLLGYKGVPTEPHGLLRMYRQRQ